LLFVVAAAAAAVAVVAVAVAAAAAAVMVVVVVVVVVVLVVVLVVGRPRPRHISFFCSDGFEPVDTFLDPLDSGTFWTERYAKTAISAPSVIIKVRQPCKHWTDIQLIS
jgi:hypothetical protein